MKKTVISISAILSSLVALVALAFTIWSFSETSKQIREAVEMGQDLTGQEYGIASFYFTSWGTPLLFALMFIGLTMLLQGQKRSIALLKSGGAEASSAVPVVDDTSALWNSNTYRQDEEASLSGGESSDSDAQKSAPDEETTN